MDTDQMIPLDELPPADPSDPLSKGALVIAAVQFIAGHDWCKQIHRGYAAVIWEGILGVFQFEIEPSWEGVDERFWVVVGDLPPAYLVLDNASKPSQALEGYVDNMSLWVRAARDGKPVDDLIPVNVPSTPEWADRLDTRLQFIERELLPRLKKKGL